MTDTASLAAHLGGTKKQRWMKKALEDIMQVQASQPPAVQQIYGGLCHRFPVMVLQCGLSQAVAFMEDKLSHSGPRGDAYKLMRSHVAELLGSRPERLAHHVADLRIVAYMHATMTLVDAAVFYKRFAVSILKVESAEADSDAE